jgi:hypothetical protein
MDLQSNLFPFRTNFRSGKGVKTDNSAGDKLSLSDKRLFDKLRNFKLRKIARSLRTSDQLDKRLSVKSNSAMCANRLVLIPFDPEIIIERIHYK